MALERRSATSLRPCRLERSCVKGSFAGPVIARDIKTRASRQRNHAETKKVAQPGREKS